jgi:glycosyltransferase involved in cell wall biosynthesis
MRTFITHGHNGMLVPPDDATQFADRIAALFEQPAQLTHMQHQAYQSAQQHAWASRVAACEAAYAWALHIAL